MQGGVSLTQVELNEIIKLTSGDPRLLSPVHPITHTVSGPIRTQTPAERVRKNFCRLNVYLIGP